MGKPEGRRPLGGPKGRKGANTKDDVKNRTVGSGVHSSGLVYGKSLWLLLNVNEYFGSIKQEEYPDLL